jgi:hypothetical protein
VSARGYGCVPNSAARDVSMSVEARHLYTIILGWPQEPDGTVLATLPQLAAALGRSRSTVARLVSELGAAALLSWTSGRHGRPNRYLPHDVVPRSRRGRSAGPKLLPGGAGPVEAEAGAWRAAGAVAGEIVAVAAEEAPELEDRGRVLDAEPGDGAGVGAGAQAAVRQTRTLVTAGSGFGSRGMPPSVRRGTAAGGGRREGPGPEVLYVRRGAAAQPRHTALREPALRSTPRAGRGRADRPSRSVGVAAASSG